MPTIEQLGAKIGDQVKVPVLDRDRSKVVSMHVCTIVGISATTTYVDPPLSDNRGGNLAIYNPHTGIVRERYEKGPAGGHRNEHGRWVTSSETYFYPVQPDVFRQERYVQGIHSGFSAYLAVDQRQSKQSLFTTATTRLRNIISQAASSFRS